MGADPNLVLDQVPSASDWNGYFRGKLDDMGYQYVSPTTGALLTAPGGLGGYLINPAADIAALTIVLPSGTVDNQRFFIKTTKTISNLTIDTPAGQTVLVSGSLGVLGAGGLLIWFFDLPLLTWV